LGAGKPVAEAATEFAEAVHDGFSDSDASIAVEESDLRDHSQELTDGLKSAQ